MERDFWLETWEKQRIGFHRPDVNPYLSAHGDRLPTGPGARVFVPLCGKSLDLVYLAEQGHEVVGVELSELAVEAFFAERSLTPRRDRLGELTRYRAGPYELYCGDLFALSPAQLGQPGAFYDNSALVALPPEMRIRYAAQIKRLLPASAVGLLVTFEYPPEEMDGPPFAVGEDELRALYESHFVITRLSEHDVLDQEPRFRARGLTSLWERVFLLEGCG